MRRLMPSKSTTSFFLSSILVVPRTSLALVDPRFEPLLRLRRTRYRPMTPRLKIFGFAEVLADEFRADHLASAVIRLPLA